MLVISCSDPSAESGTTTHAGTISIPSPLSFDGDIANLIVGDIQLVVAVADEFSERERGLSEVSDLGGVDGMLFVFERPRILRFNMEDTMIPLDLWFIDETGTIVGHLELEPCTEEPCPRYPSEQEVALALETPLGQFDFNLGDNVSWSVSS